MQRISRVTPASGEPENHRRHAQDRVARDAAEPGRQWPGTDARQRGCKSCGQQGRDDPHQASPLFADRTMPDQTPAEQCLRNQQQDGGEAEQLHGEVGENRAGITEQIVDRLLCRVAQRWILHRPCRKRDGAKQRQRDQRETGKFAQATPYNVAEMLREEGDDIETAIGCPHAITSLALNRARRRGDAAPPPWPLCPAPLRRGYNPRRDCCRRPARARDSAPARRARPLRPTAAW